MAIIPDGRGATSESRPSPPWGGRSGLQTGVHVADGMGELGHGESNEKMEVLPSKMAILP